MYLFLLMSCLDLVLSYPCLVFGLFFFFLSVLLVLSRPLLSALVGRVRARDMACDVGRLRARDMACEMSVFM